MKTIEHFVNRCDAYAHQRKISRSYVSRLLFDDGKVLDAISSGVADITHRRLGRAEDILGEFERALTWTSPPSERELAGG